jgi:hypothetical protein
MLTGAVNIAVFAAFWPCVGGVLLSDAEFKPSGGDRQLDISRYGWQKRQDRGKKWQRGGNGWQWMARPAAKTARMGGDVAASSLPRRRLHAGEAGLFRADMRLLRCWRRRVAPWL